MTSPVIARINADHIANQAAQLRAQQHHAKHYRCEVSRLYEWDWMQLCFCGLRPSFGHAREVLRAVVWC